jgi:hypothetical protein
VIREFQPAPYVIFFVLLISWRQGPGAVLPGLEAAFPPIKQKSTAIWRKLTAISNFSKIPLLFRYFWSFGKR